MSKSLIKKSENQFENTFMKLVNSHSLEYLDTVSDYSEDNIDKIIEGADNIQRIKKFAVSKLKIADDNLNSNERIRNKEAIVKEDKSLVNPENTDAYALLREDQI